MAYLQLRLHSRAELFRKLKRREYGELVVDGVLDDLARLGYVNDERVREDQGAVRRPAQAPRPPAGVHGVAQVWRKR